MMAFSQEDKDQMAAIFTALGAKPKMDTPGDFKAWMESYLGSQSHDPEEHSQSDADKKSKDSTVQIVTQLPTIVKFSGQEKGDQVSFDLWRYEVQSLMEEGVHKPEVIYQAVRRSLRGEASRVAMRLGPKASLETLLKKLEGIYGIIELGEDILAQFYSASQKEDEDVVSWSLNIENILDKAVEQEQVTKAASEEMLRSKFWTGLRQDLKDATRHHYEAKMDFDHLRVEARRVEQERHTPTETKPKKTAHTKVQQSNFASDSLQNDMKELKGLVKGLTTKVDSLDTQVKAMKSQPNQRNFSAAGRGHRQMPVPNAVGGSPSLHNVGNQNFGNPFFNVNDFAHPQYGNQNRGNQPSSGPGEPIICYRCGQEGHIRIGCKANLHLNR